MQTERAVGFRSWLLVQDPGTLHVFIVQSSTSSDKYYSVYDTQAHTLARMYYQTASGGSGADVVKKEADGDRGHSIDVLHVSRRLLGVVAKEALDRNEKVQLWRKAAANSRGGGWVPAYHVASPGRFACLEEELGASFRAAAGQAGAARDPVLAAAVQNAAGLGICVCQSLEHRLVVYEVASDRAPGSGSGSSGSGAAANARGGRDGDSAADVELILVQAGVREVIVDSDFDCSQNASLVAAIRRTGAALTVIAALEEATAAAEAEVLCAALQTIARAEKFAVKDSAERPLALLAAGSLLAHTNCAADTYELAVGSLSGCLLYDAAAAKALGLLPAASNGTALGKNSHTSFSPAPPLHDDDDDEADDGSAASQSGSSANCVFGLLSASLKSAMGRRKLRQWLQQPLCGAQGERLIRQRQHAISLLSGPHKQACEKLRSCLSSCPDIQTVASRFSVQRKVKKELGAATSARAGEKRRLDGSSSSSSSSEGKGGGVGDLECRASLQDALQIYMCVMRLSSMVSALEEAQFQEYVLHAARACVQQLSRFQALVEEVVDTEPPAGYKTSGFSDRHGKFLYWLARSTQGGAKRVRPEFSPQLTRSHENLQALRSSMTEEADACEASLGAAGSSAAKKPTKGAKAASRVDQTFFLEHSTVHGVHLRVTKRNSSSALAVLRNRGYDVRILSTQNAGVLFVTPRLEQYWTQYVHHLSIRVQLESNIVQQAMRVACTYQAPIRELSSLLAEVDVLTGLAHVAGTNEWTCPQILHPHEGDCEDVVEVRALRHCIVESQVGRNSYIPSDFRLCGSQRLALLTGPNMGGKSTYIRAIGVIAILAQIGSFVPAAVCKLPLFDRILCRVGACDSLSRGISTFKAEMDELADILRKATNRSLVIVDELGRGTSTHDGFGIAAAAVQRLCTSAAVSVFATHFHELTLLADGQGPPIIPGLQGQVINLHVGALVAGEEAQGTVTMLYEVSPGPCLQSYGIHVARLARMPEQVIRDASRIAQGLDGIVGH